MRYPGIFLKAEDMREQMCYIYKTCRPGLNKTLFLISMVLSLVSFQFNPESLEVCNCNLWPWKNDKMLLGDHRWHTGGRFLMLIHRWGVIFSLFSEVQSWNVIFSNGSMMLRLRYCFSWIWFTLNFQNRSYWFANPPAVISSERLHNCWWSHFDVLNWFGGYDENLGLISGTFLFGLFSFFQEHSDISHKS